MNIPVIFQFLKELSANNNREWFNAHREQYENARNEFENLLTVIISRISLFDESIRGLESIQAFNNSLINFSTYLGFSSHGFPKIKRLIKIILAAISMPKERNQTIADTMFIYNRATAFWQVAVIARPLPC